MPIQHDHVKPRRDNPFQYLESFFANIHLGAAYHFEISDSMVYVAGSTGRASMHVNLTTTSQGRSVNRRRIFPLKQCTQYKQQLKFKELKTFFTLNKTVANCFVLRTIRPHACLELVITVFFFRCPSFVKLNLLNYASVDGAIHPYHFCKNRFIKVIISPSINYHFPKVIKIHFRWPQ